MDIQRMKLADLTPADYNPRKDLTPEDAEYQKLKRSLENFGMVEPVIYNKRTGNLVGGHQRLKILQELGETETDVVVVDLDKRSEKRLNVTLNRAKGRWDNEKLAEVLKDLQERGDVTLTGFDDYELQGIIEEYSHLADILEYTPPEPQAADEEESPPPETFSYPFSIPAEYEEEVNTYLETYDEARARLAAAVMQTVRGEG